MGDTFLRRIAVFGFLLCVMARVAAQPTTTLSGRNFWLSCVPPQGVSAPDLTLRISAMRQCVGTISSPLLGWSMPFTVSADSATVVEIPDAYPFPARSATVQRNVIHVAATDTISLFAEVGGDSAGATMRVLPDASLGSHYLLQAQPGGVSSLLVVATGSGRTMVSIVPSCAVQGYGANWRFSFSLVQGQCYMLQTMNAGDDLTGTIVETDDCKPLAVYTGSSTRAGAAGHGVFVMDEAFPVERWGNRFLLTPTGCVGGEAFGVTAADTCTVWLGGDTLMQLSPRETRRLPLPRAGQSLIETSAAAQVCHYMNDDSGRVAAMCGVAPLAWTRPLRFTAETPAGQMPLSDGSVVHICDGDTLRLAAADIPMGAHVSWIAGEPSALPSFSRLSREWRPAHRYAGAGLYQAMLAVSYDSLGCGVRDADTLRFQVAVHSHVQTALRDTSCAAVYVWHGQNIRTSGSYTHVLNTVYGCDSTLHLALTLATSASATLYDTLPQSRMPYLYNGFRITFTGDDTTCQFRLTTTLGCDSMVTLHLHLLRTSMTTIDTLVCDDALPLIWRGALFTEGGSRYVRAGTASDGSDSLVELRLRVGRTWTVVEADTICAGVTFQWAGMSLVSDGEYTASYATVEGCDSVAIVRLTVNPVYWHTVSDTTVENHLPYYFSGRSYSGPVSADTIRLLTLAGCDSIVVYSLHVWPNIADTIFVESCDRYLWRGVWRQRTGYYREVSAGRAPGGADSIHWLQLIIGASIHTSLYDTCCDSYTWHGSTYNTSGVYIYRYVNVDSCETIDTLHLVVGHPSRSDTSVSACNIYYWNGITFNMSADTALTVGYNVYGCDSTAALHLEVHYSSWQRRGDTVGENDLPWRFGGVTFYHSVSDTLLRYRTAYGCDSTVAYTLHVRYGAHGFVDTSVCDNNFPLIWRGHTYLRPDSFTDTLYGSSSTGGDSVVTYTVRELPTWFLRYNDTLCEGETYTFNGGVYTASGHYRWYTNTAMGCDSVTDLTLTFMPTWSVRQVDTVVESQLPWHYSGVWFNREVPDTLFRFISRYGCDSLVSYRLVVWYDASLRLDSAVCSNELPVQWCGETFWGAGSRVLRYPGMAQGGADSVVVLYLNVYPVYVDRSIDTICQGQTVEMGGEVYSSTGFYERWFRSTVGCDSVQQLMLTVNPTNDTAMFDTIVENQLPWNFAGRIFRGAAQSDTIVLANRYGCDSIILYNLHVYRNIYDTIDTLLCGDGLPLLWRGQRFDTGDLDDDGVALRTLTFARRGRHGVDSLLTMRLRAHSVYNLHFYDTVCSELFVTFDGHLLSEPGNYTYSYLTRQGCDSIRTMHLRNWPAYYDLIDTLSICDGQVFRAEGYTLWETCDRLLRLHTSHGCDSIVQLHLDVWPVYDTAVVDTVCDNVPYLFAGHSVADAGVHSYVLPTVHGCDSTLTLHLAWRPHVEAAFTVQPSVIGPEDSELRIYDASTGATRRLWTLPDRTDTARFLRYIMPTGTDSLELTLQVWNGYGCTDTAYSMLRRRYSDLWAPNAFTPSEPVNNRFGLWADSLATLEVEIYSRSGLRVAVLSEVGATWDGTSAGRPCPQGVYVYVARYTFAYSPTTTRTKKGTLLLLR